MDKILSKDTIKNVFSALGAKTSDSNYGVALLDKTSGEPKGFMGMSDLASVLGAVYDRGYNADVDQIGTYVAGVNSNIGGYEYWGIVVSFAVTYAGNKYCFQIYRRWSGEVKTRMCSVDGWSAWV